MGGRANTTLFEVDNANNLRFFFLHKKYWDIDVISTLYYIRSGGPGYNFIYDRQLTAAAADSILRLSFKKKKKKKTIFPHSICNL